MSVPNYISNAHTVFATMVKDAMDYFGTQEGCTVTELDDAVVVENNNDKLLANGYGIEWGEDTNEDTMLSGYTGLRQTVEVVFTTGNFGSINDTDIRKQSEKHLLKMKDMLMSYLASNPTLDDNVAKCIYSGSGRFEYVFPDENNVYLMKRSTFTIGYFEKQSTLT